MHTIYISNEKLNSFPAYITNDVHSESKIYLYNNLLFKIYNFFSIYNKEENVEANDTVNFIDGCIFPKSKIYINGIFKGITYEYYEEYKSLNRNLNNIDLNSKINTLKKCSNNLKKMHLNNLVHTDINLYNIITNGEDILFIDMDSAILNIDDFDKAKSHDIVSYINTSLSYIYEIRFGEIIFKYGFDEFLKAIKNSSMSSKLKEYIINSFIFMDADEYVTDYLNDFDQEQINYDKNNVFKKFIKIK